MAGTSVAMRIAFPKWVDASRNPSTRLNSAGLDLEGWMTVRFAVGVSLMAYEFVGWCLGIFIQETADGPCDRRSIRLASPNLI